MSSSSQPGVDSTGSSIQHPLSLKVMRVSRPSVAPYWSPFFSSSPSFSAHSTADALSLQGSDPFHGHPKTLRDLSNAGQTLTLPAAFGAIQLGETFSCCLAVNNETNAGVDAVALKVEMQTATNKTTLVEIGGVEHQLPARDTLEAIVSQEIRELGLHVLACSVSYFSHKRLTPSSFERESGDDENMQYFRKFYKFTVTNPLSVKTKVHAPRSPTALMSRLDRDKVFLEVHIQNLTQNPLWFERIRLEPVDGWQATDGNDLNSFNEGGILGREQSVFTGSIGVMQPQDVRQYIYILKPVPSSITTPFVVSPPPGTTVPLGRLDISWRSSMGEPGRLLTSVLSRRTPVSPAPPPSNAVAAPSALPPHVQKSVLPRSRSPSVASQHRVSTPPLPPTSQRPGSPLKKVTLPSPMSSRPTSPGPGPNAHHFGVVSPSPQPTAIANARPDIEADLFVIETPPESIVRCHSPFVLRCCLALSTTNHPTGGGKVIKLAIQHVIRISADKMEHMGGVKRKRIDAVQLEYNATPILSSRSGSIDAITPRQVLTPGPGTPGGTTSRGLSSPELVLSPTTNVTNLIGDPLADHLTLMSVGRVLEQDADNASSLRLPPPFGLLPLDELAFKGQVRCAGPSTVILAPVSVGHGKSGGRVEEMLEFSLDYMPLSRGFARVGGLRVWLLDVLSTDNDHDAASAENEPRLLREWDVIGEVWVT